MLFSPRVFRSRLCEVIVGLVMFVPALRAQADPGAIPGLNLWLKADAGLYQDTSLTLAAGLYSPVGIWTDQSGSGNHATTPNPAATPFLVPNDFNGMPAVRFLPDVNRTMATPPFLDRSFRSAITIYAVHQGYNEAVIFSDAGQNLSLNVSHYLYQSFHTSGLSASDNQIQTEYDQQAPSIDEFAYDGNFSTLTGISNGITYTNQQAGTGALGASGRLTIGGDPIGKSLFQGDIAEILVYNRALSPAEKQLVRDYLKSKYAITGDPTGSDLLVFDGDSITWGYRSTGGMTYPNQLVASLGSEYSATNLAVPGQTTANVLANGNRVDQQAHATKNNFLLVMAGTNDIVQGVGADDTYSHLVAYCQQRRLAGYKLIVLSLLPANSPGFEVQRQAFNQRLRDNWPTFADAFADIGSDPRIGDPNAPAAGAYFSDDFHPNNSGYGIMASLVQPVVQNLAQQFGSCVTAIGSSNTSFGPQGGTGIMQISPPGCVSRVNFDSPWISKIAFVPGAPGQLSFSVLPNAAATGRAGSLTVAGQSLSIVQAGTQTGVASVDSISPANGSGTNQSFTFSLSDSSGYKSLQSLSLVFNKTLTNAGSCSLVYDQTAGSYSLWNDTGTTLLGPALAGTDVILRNSQCTFDAGGSFAQSQANTLTLTISLSFFPSFRGPQTVYVNLSDTSGVFTGWAPVGAWTPN